MSIHITIHNKDTKMAGIQSISTSVLLNPICQKRSKVPGSVCEKCFAEKLLGYRKPLAQCLERNYQELNDHLLSRDEAASVVVTSILGRIESFGDVATVMQARNYIRIMDANPDVRWGIWSKNAGIWVAAFHLEHKPKNCTFVLSSPELNVITDVPEWMKEYVDHVFTVWDKKEYDLRFKGDKVTECAGIRCMNCQKCYHKGGSFYINERLR